MRKAHLEWKVGLFVLISLVLLAAVVLRFSKGTSLFAQAYDLRMTAKNVGGIIPGAMVLMAGIPVGHVVSTELENDGKSVVIGLRILQKYPIHGDAIFSVDQTGFLGDRYVAIVPTTNALPVLGHRASIRCQEPFELMDVARSTAGLLRRMDETAERLSEAVGRIDRSLFNDSTLSNVTTTVGNFRLISERAMAALEGVDQFVQTNRRPMSTTVSNLVVFSEQLNQVAQELQSAVSTNRPGIRATIQNIESASLQVDRLMTDLQAGKGVAGNLLKNEQLEKEFRSTVSQLSLLSSNLNRFGILWKPKVKAVTPTPSVISPRKSS